MVRLFDLRFDQFMGRYGFLVGAALVLAAGVGLLIVGRSARTPAALALCVLGVVGGAFAVQAVPRFAHAAQRAAFAPPPRAPTGPYAVVEANLILPPAGSGASPIRALVFAPAAPGQKAPGSCAALSGLRLPDAAGQAAPETSSRPAWPLLLFAPGLEGGAREMASIAAELASRGFFIVALDDPLSQTPPPRPTFFDFSSDEAFAATLRRSEAKAQADARRALDALDRLRACAGAAFSRSVDFNRVGFFGFSFGGGVAATAASLDPRVVAAANIDGWVFGEAETRLDKPYLALFSDEPLPTREALKSEDPARRNYARQQRDFVAAQARLFEDEGKFGFQLRNTAHGDFTDAAFARTGRPDRWVFVDPDEVHGVAADYLAAFFGAYLRGEAGELLRAAPPPARGVIALKGRRGWAEGDEPVPVRSWFGLD
ncbi:dienelactone hydrolase family protein [Methylocella sp.]|uniref:dienelactone hydrolase family protein n=1 Tax=Methylocella sp. TaxID=1978226 RepID=UPI0037847050